MAAKEATGAKDTTTRAARAKRRDFFMETLLFLALLRGS
jgi:hypothetical protein